MNLPRILHERAQTRPTKSATKTKAVTSVTNNTKEALEENKVESKGGTNRSD